jgi:hypothetical protein
MSVDKTYILERVKDLALALPAAYEKLSYGTPGFFVEKKLFARIKEDGATLVVYNNERDELIAEDPYAFFITDHYRNYPMLLINLVKIKQARLQELLKISWQIRAPKKLLKENS